MGDDRSLTHMCPVDGDGLTGCCYRTPFELPVSDRLTTHPDYVTCTRYETADRDMSPTHGSHW